MKSENRIVNYDPNESTWKFANLVSQIPDNMLTESLVFNPPEKEISSEISYTKAMEHKIQYLEKKILHLEQELTREKVSNFKLHNNMTILANNYDEKYKDIVDRYNIIREYLKYMFPKH